jgi:hypothetical protein
VGSDGDGAVSHGATNVGARKERHLETPFTLTPAERFLLTQAAKGNTASSVAHILGMNATTACRLLSVARDKERCRMLAEMEKRRSGKTTLSKAHHQSQRQSFTRQDG